MVQVRLLVADVAEWADRLRPGLADNVCVRVAGNGCRMCRGSHAIKGPARNAAR